MTTQGSGGQKRMYPCTTTSNEKKPIKKQNTNVKGNGKNVSSNFNDPKNKYFKGKYNYCHEFRHEKDCRKLKVIREKKVIIG